MLCVENQQPHDDDLFQVPYGPVLKWIEIKAMYPTVVESLDGSTQDSCYLFYFELNPLTKIYKPIDEDSEYDIATIFDIDLNIISNGENEHDTCTRHEKEDRNKMFQDYTQPYLDYLEQQDNYNESKLIKKQTKKDKKERRRLLVESRKTK